MPSHQQQAIDTWRSNGEIRKVSPTGVAGVSEFVEIGRGTWEIHPAPQGSGIADTSGDPTRSKRRQWMEVGVGHSSEETSNDRGAKG